MMKSKGIVMVACVSLGMVFMSDETLAHGYVMEPASRVYKGTSAIGLNQNIGQGMYEPQSIEAPKGFPERATSPKDGKIASGGKAGFEPLDEQTTLRWHKTTIASGKLEVSWFLTAQHKTESWEYFMTKQGWNPEQPLNRQTLERIDRIAWQGELPEQIETQTVNVPVDRTGYHVILAVWNIADTENAFYQAIDVNVVRKGQLPEDTEAPSQPTKVRTTHLAFNQVALTWQAASDNVGVSHYQVLRDGQVIGTTKTTDFTDTHVNEASHYSYTIKAVDQAGNQSQASRILEVETPAKPLVDTEAPSVPTGLLAHMTTKDSTMLHWKAATDNVKVDHYQVLREGQIIATTKQLMYTDKNLKAGTSYRYSIIAVDSTGNRSAASRAIIVTTESDPGSNGQATSLWEKNTIYTGGEIVCYDGFEYRAKWWTCGENPASSAVWELVSVDKIVEWNSQKAYLGGE